jgi:hypothetical protein
MMIVWQFECNKSGSKQWQYRLGGMVMGDGEMGR